MKAARILPRAAFIVTVVAVLVAGGMGGIAFAAAGTASAPHPAPYPGVGTATSAPSPTPAFGRPATSAGPVTAATCTPYVDGDNAHLSSGDVSAHGWWYLGNCANQKTTVTIYLYEYFSDGTWHYQSQGQAYVWPGGGSANRAVARQVCEGVAIAAWRSLVVVSLGNGASAYTPFQNLTCTHW